MDKKEIIEYLLVDNKSGYKTREKHFKKMFPNLIEIINKYNDIFFKIELPFTQKLYNFLYDVEKIPKCENCGNEIKWRGIFTEGYLKYCSKNCANMCLLKIEGMKKTNLERYGVDSVSKVSEFKTKRKNTYLEKFGVENIFENDEIIRKTKETNLKKYGTEYVSQSPIIKDRMIKNSIAKYGVDSPNKLESIKNKCKKAILDKYGVDSVMKVDEFRIKCFKSSIEKSRKKYKEIFGDDFEIEWNDGCVIIKNQCKIHPSYEINNILFYCRVFQTKMENPCILCYPLNENSSIKEIEIRNFIENELQIKTEKIKIENKEIDIYSSEHKIGIEHDGIYWHSDKFKKNDINYHLSKTELCEKNNIQLIHIFEDEWIYKKDIVRSIIKSKFKIFDYKIFARKCIIKEIDSKISSKFLNENHIQGNVNTKIKIGLFYDNNLVSIMTFGKKRKALGSKNDNADEYELLRFCNKLNTQVIGGASRLLKYFIKNYKPKFIISYADRRYSKGDLYEKLGFKFLYNTKPNYWYHKGNSHREHRFKYRKDILIKNGYDPNKTEREIMQERGFYRVFDCGSMKFELNL